jgi:hypothetical protein
MNADFRKILNYSPKTFITNHDLSIALENSDDARQALIKRALKKEELIQLKNGYYLIGQPYNKKLPNLFEIAQQLYGSTYISLESALSFHGWIPEAVYTITSVTPKRAKEFMTPIGRFSYAHVPINNFFMGVNRVEQQNEIYLMASPWRALGDFVYVHRKLWQSLKDIMSDLRVEEKDLRSIDLKLLKSFSENYPSKRVQIFYLNMLKELS